MSGNDSFEDRLRRQEEARKLDALSDATTQAEVNELIRFSYANAKTESGRLADLIEQCIVRANKAIGGSAEPFKFQRNGLDMVRRGMAAAQVVYSQLIMNAGPQQLSIVIYAGQPVGAIPSMLSVLGPSLPAQKEYTFQPLPKRTSSGQISIMWQSTRDKNACSSEELAEFVVEAGFEMLRRS